MERNLSQLRTSYDLVAEEYAAHIFHELDGKPFDRAFLERFAARVSGKVCDMGCGPGHVARFLHERGVDMMGIDASAGMVTIAQRLNPAITFRQGDMAQLDVEDGAWGGIVAFYSILHTSREAVTQVLREFWRVLQAGGLLVLSFHAGQEVRHIEELWGKNIMLDFVFFESAEMEVYLREAGFEIVESNEREPYEERVEVQTRRAYILARKAREP